MFKWCLKRYFEWNSYLFKGQVKAYDKWYIKTGIHNISTSLSLYSNQSCTRVCATTCHKWLFVSFFHCISHYPITWQLLFMKNNNIAFKTSILLIPLPDKHLLYYQIIYSITSLTIFPQLLLYNIVFICFSSQQTLFNSDLF